MGLGCAVVVSLRQLRATAGQGRSASPDLALQLFIDVTSAAWLAATSAAVCLARRREFVGHARCMQVSFALMCVPLAQRLTNYAITPLLMVARQLPGGPIKTPLAAGMNEGA